MTFSSLQWLEATSLAYVEPPPAPPPYDNMFMVSYNISGNTRSPNTDLFGINTSNAIVGMAGPTTSNAAYCNAFSPNGIYVAVCGTQAGTLNIFKRVGATNSYNQAVFSSPLLTQQARSVSWSPDSKFVIVTYISAAPYMRMWSRTGDTFTQVTLPAVVGSQGSGSAAFSPSGKYIAITTNANATGLQVFMRNPDDTFTNLGVVNNISGTLAFTGLGGPSWSADDNYFVTPQAGAGTGSMRVVKRTSETTFDLLPVFSTVTSNSYSPKFTPDGNWIVVGKSVAPWVHVFQRSGDNFTLVTGLITGLPARPVGITINDNGMIIIVTASNGMWRWQYANNTFTFVDTMSFDTAVSASANDATSSWPPVKYVP